MEKFDTPQKGAFDTCGGKIEVPTQEERAILAKMKALKEHVRGLKSRLNALTSSGRDENGNDVAAVKKELVHLKDQWNALDEKRQRAAKERMRLLGHEGED